jgi:dTDP-4-dehydrorhamnose 3,5-epimerase-like enzyme
MYEAHSMKHDLQTEIWPTGPIISMSKPFEDERGAIQPIVEGDFNTVQIITSKAGSVRANHYHKTDWHYCYMVSGCMKYHHRPAGSETPPEWLLVSAGQTVFTPPLVEHAMEFLEDSAFLNITRNPRDQAHYEEDLVRVVLVNREAQ